jgi:succinate dehydrogenase cytochrome b556 subunit
VFVWIFHRISGLLLIVLLALQMFTGFFLASASRSASSDDLAVTLKNLHNHQVVLCLLVFLVIFHGLYGIRTILIDLGVKKEKHLFWACTLAGLVLFVAFLILYFTLVAA